MVDHLHCTIDTLGCGPSVTRIVEKEFTVSIGPSRDLVRLKKLSSLTKRESMFQNYSMIIGSSLRDPPLLNKTLNYLLFKSDGVV